MTTQYGIWPGESGKTGLTVNLFVSEESDDVLYTSDSMLERTNAKGQYRFTFGELAVIPAGDYFGIVTTGAGVVVSMGWRTFAGTDGETATTTVLTAALDSASRLAIWNTLTTETFTADSFGELLLISDGTNGREVKVTGANHIAADVHEFQAGVITAGDFAANSITASALATDAVTEIQNGLATSAALATESGKITNIENASGYLLAVLAGACADPQTASETYAITVFGSTFTVDMAGQTSTGTRTAPTLTKT